MKTKHTKSQDAASRPAAQVKAEARRNVAGRDLAAAIDGSPRVAAQRRQIEGAFGGPVQRAADDEELLQGKLDPVQRQDEEELLQGKLDPVQRQAQGAEASGGAGLPARLRAGVESLSGMDMSGVRVHRDSSEPADVGALAFARGNDIHLGAGQDRHLPHEAWHVVQQRQGRVEPTVQLREGIPVNDDPALEHEADVMGERAAEAGSRLVSDQG